MRPPHSHTFCEVTHHNTHVVMNNTGFCWDGVRAFKQVIRKITEVPMISQSSQVRRWFALAAAVVLLPAWAMAQDPAAITGRVTNSAGEPLSSANVTIAQLNIVAYTSPGGSYRLVVPGARAQDQEVVLSARLIGYRAQSSTIRLTPGANLVQNFALAPDPLRLSEVVVTGAGTETIVERLGTARASLDAVTL